MNVPQKWECDMALALTHDLATLSPQLPHVFRRLLSECTNIHH